MTPMTDEQLDRAVTSFLGWQAAQLEGAPDAGAVAWRIAAERLTPRPRWQRVTLGLAVVGLLVVALVGAAVIATRSPGPVLPANGPIVVSNAMGWQAIDPSSGAASAIEPCGGQCPEAFMPVLSADGQTVFYVVPTPMDGDDRPTGPGWSLWRWDRAAESTTSVHICKACMIAVVVPSPDGRSLALLASAQARPTAPTDLVVIDSTTGQEIYRTADLGAARDLGPFIPAWDARGRLLVGRMSEGGPIRERIDLATGIAEEVGRGLPVGVLLSSPDGRNLVIGAGDRSQIDLHVVDPDLGRSRPLARLDGTPAAWATWAPDRTALAILTFFASTNSAFAHNEILIVDVATGSVDRHPIDAVGGQLMWLPEDQAGAP